MPRPGMQRKTLVKEQRALRQAVLFPAPGKPPRRDRHRLPQRGRELRLRRSSPVQRLPHNRVNPAWLREPLYQARVRLCRPARCNRLRRL